jgi:hypothetical protein
MQDATYETKDHHTVEDIKTNLTRTIEYLMIVRSRVDRITDDAQREQCFEASNELVAIGASLEEGMLMALGKQSDRPAPVTERASTPSTAPQSVARPRG